MTSREFCYWLQGYFELQVGSQASLTIDQTIAIRNHLAMVFKHEIDPSAGNKKHQDELNEIHNFIGPNTRIRC